MIGICLEESGSQESTTSARRDREDCTEDFSHIRQALIDYCMQIQMPTQWLKSTLLTDYACEFLNKI